MLQVTVISVGKLKEKYLIDGIKEYAKRLSKYAKPSKGGTIQWAKPTEGERVGLFDKHVAYMTGILDSAGATYTKTSDGAGGYTITMPENTNYIGQPTRLNGKIKPLLDRALWSEPSEVVVNGNKITKIEDGGAILDFPAGGVGEREVKGKFVFIDSGSQKSNFNDLKSAVEKALEM